jgi:hypothetical protein
MENVFAAISSVNDVKVFREKPLPHALPLQRVELSGE